MTNGNGGTLSAYSISAGGALTAVTGSPVATGTTPSSVTVGYYPDTFFVYVANQEDDTVSAFTANGSNPSGALIAVSGSPFAVGSGPRAVTVDPSGQYVYVANAASNTLSGYNFYNNNLGTPAALSGSPYTTGTSPDSVAVDPLDNFVYVANEASNNISAYALGAGGALTAITGSPFAAGDGPSAVAVDPTGRFVYVANSRSGTISVFAITGSTGALSAGELVPPYAAGSLPSAIALSD